MHLGDYLWQKRKTYKKFSEDINVCHRTTAQYVNGEFSASLLPALKIFAITLGEVDYINLLSKSDLDKLDEFLTNLSEKQKNHNVIAYMQAKIIEAKKSREGVDLD
jgi:hypothetical protein